jgi:hypothetical protein
LKLHLQLLLPLLSLLLLATLLSAAVAAAAAPLPRHSQDSPAFFSKKHKKPPSCQTSSHPYEGT